MLRLKKILRMPPRELAYRAGELTRVRLERLGVAQQPPSAPPNFRQYLRGQAVQRFYRWPSTSTFRASFPEWVDRAVKEAEALCRNEVPLLNYGLTALGDEINWQRDPLTGQIWEEHFWADYRPETEHGGRDIKRVHELNRHQHLPRLAKAFYLTGEERYAKSAIAQLETWIDQNPPGRGVNWQSSLEIAIRAISWLWTIFLLADSEALYQSTAQRIGDSLFAQLEHVHRYTSRFSSPNTHLIGEAAALFIAGLVFRDLERPAKWLKHGLAVLVDQADKQIMDDGVHAELSTYYHCYTLDFYLQAFVSAEQNECSFPETVRKKIAGMWRFLEAITRSDGTIPLFGDDDGGRALALQETTYRRFGYDTGEERLWLAVRPVDWKSAIPAESPSLEQKVFPTSGYAVQHSGGDRLIFDFGGLGMMTGGHSHADALSFALFSRGRDLLVDPGTFVYNCAPRWRDYFRSTAAHNSVIIDGRNQAEPGGTFRWNSRWHTRLNLRFERDWMDYIEAEQDAYLASRGIVHRRRLLYIRGEYWVLVDDFRGSGRHSFDLAFHLGLEVEPSKLVSSGTGFVLREDHGMLLGLQASGPVTSELADDWVSSGYGEKRRSRTVRARLTASAPSAAIACIVPSQRTAVFHRIEASHAVACSYRQGAFEDIVVFSSGQNPVRVLNFEMQGEFFWLRAQDGEPRLIAAIRALSVSQGGADVFRQSQPGSYFGLQGQSLCAPSAAC